MSQSLAANTASFELVRGEVETTIRQAEQSLDQFQENRESSEDLQNCVDFINQLRGIFVLVQLQGGVMLCQEAVSLANEVPVGATDDKNTLLTTLNNSLFVLRRYIEYFRNVGQDHPELLLPIINELRTARNVKAFPDSHFFELDVNKGCDCCSPFKNQHFLPIDDFDHHARRYRQMYQIALLGFIREKDLDVSFKVLARSMEGFSRLSGQTPLRQLWCLVNIVANAMGESGMIMTHPRKRLFMKIEKYTKEMVYLGRVATSKTAPDSIIRELVFLLALSGSSSENTLFVLNSYGKEPLEFSDEHMIRHRKLLFGPGVDTLEALSTAFQEELAQLKDKLDIIERGIDPDVSDFSNVVSLFQRLSDTLNMLELHQLAELMGKQVVLLNKWSESGVAPCEEELLDMADAVLAIEQASKNMAETGLSSEVDDLANFDSCVSDDSLFLSEAMKVVIGETHSGIALTKRAITAYIESNYDKANLANVSATLAAMAGSMKMISQERLAASIDKSNEVICSELIENATKPDERKLETLADILTSLEYYIDSLAKREAPSDGLLELTEESLKSIDYVI
ncbi:MAG: chemotaxis protein [Gammaproteobacteria bacterium]|nr:MAG: chemotaxis protein [Gammaproteobacteria bacterium]